MYLQLMWQAEQQGDDLDALPPPATPATSRTSATSAGPSGAYDPTEFGSGNVYFGPAFMWHELRRMLGDDEFFAIVRGWPESQDNRSTDRETFLAYIEDESGKDLDDFWDAWLLGDTTPTTG